MYLVRWVSCPRLESHDHNSHIANLAAGANVVEKEEQGDQYPESSMVIGGERMRLLVSD